MSIKIIVNSKEELESAVETIKQIAQECQNEKFIICGYCGFEYECNEEGGIPVYYCDECCNSAEGNLCQECDGDE